MVFLKFLNIAMYYAFKNWTKIDFLFNKQCIIQLGERKEKKFSILYFLGKKKYFTKISSMILSQYFHLSAE